MNHNTTVPMSYFNIYGRAQPPAYSLKEWVDVGTRGEVVVGSSNRNFPVLIERAMNATSSYTKTRYDGECIAARAGYFGRYGTPGAQYEGFSVFVWPRQPSFPGANSSLVTSVDQWALSAFITKAASPSFNAGTFLGELRETVHSLRHPLQSISKIVSRGVKNLGPVRKARYRNRLNAEQLKHTLQDTWLEVHFGLIPFLGDIESILDAYYTYLEKVSPQVRIAAKSAESYISFSEVGSSTANVGGFTRPLRYSQQTVCNVEVRYIGSYLPNYSLARVGMDPSGLVATAWELMPFSWLVDYFSNVGAIIQAIPVIAKNWIYVSKSTKILEESTVTYTADPQDLPHWYSSEGRNLHTKLSFTRSDVLGSLRIPNPSVRIPGSGQLENVVALILSKLSHWSS